MLSASNQRSRPGGQLVVGCTLRLVRYIGSYPQHLEVLSNRTQTTYHVIAIREAFNTGHSSWRPTVLRSFVFSTFRTCEYRHSTSQ
jgi:hypothetical protein